MEVGTVFQQSVPRRVSDAPIAIELNTIKLDYPMLKALLQAQLPGSHLPGLRIESNDGLGPGSTCRCADTQNVGQTPVIDIVGKARVQRLGCRKRH